jgi:hypothetical protein
MTVAQFELLPIEEKIAKVRDALESGGTLDPGYATFLHVTDTVVVERDSGLSGGLMIGYFFRDPAHLAAARWSARQDMLDVDLDELTDDDDLDEIEEIFSGQVAGEKTLFEGSVTDLLQGESGGEMRALWRERSVGGLGSARERPIPDGTEQQRFLHFIRTGEIADVDDERSARSRSRNAKGAGASAAGRAAGPFGASDGAASSEAKSAASGVTASVHEPKPKSARGYVCPECRKFHEGEEIPEREDVWICDGEGVTSSDICEYYEEGECECEHEMADGWELPCGCLVTEEPEIVDIIPDAS